MGDQEVLDFVNLVNVEMLKQCIPTSRIDDSRTCPVMNDGAVPMSDIQNHNLVAQSSSSGPSSGTNSNSSGASLSGAPADRFTTARTSTGSLDARTSDDIAGGRRSAFSDTRRSRSHDGIRASIVP